MQTHGIETSDTSVEVFQIKDGWEPFLLEDISPTSMPNVFRLLGLYQGHRREIFTLQTGLQVRAPYFIRAMDDLSFELSTYRLTSAESNELCFVARLYLSDFGALQPLRSEGVSDGRVQRLQRADRPSLTKSALPRKQGNKKLSDDHRAKKFREDAKRLAKSGPQAGNSSLNPPSRKNKRQPKSASTMAQKTSSLGPTAMQLAYERAKKTGSE